MSERSHDELEGLIAADALDGLSEADRRRMLEEMAAHGPACAECGRLLTDYSQVAVKLATLVEPMPVSAGAERRLVRAIGPSDAGPQVEDRGPARRTTLPRRWAAALAVAASLVAAGGIGYAVAPHAKGVQVVAFPAPGAQSLAVAYQPGERTGVLVGTNLPDPPAGKVYELWFQPSRGAPMRPAGTFRPSAGQVRVPVSLGTSFTALAVSVEPRGGSAHPTSNPIFLTSVPPAR